MKLAALVSLVFATAAMGAPPPAATPVGPWVVDFDPRHCIASRQFDAGGIPIILGIEAIPTQDAHYIYFQRSGKLRVMALESAAVWLGGKRAKSGALIGVPVVQKDNVRYSTSLDVEEYRQFVDGTPLSVRSSPIKVALPPMNLKAVDARLTDCASLMLESWGLSHAEQLKLASFPKIKPAEKAKISFSDYPQGAERRGAMGGVRLLVDVDAAGQMTNCRVMRSSGHGDLDANACLELRSRVRFDPALDRQGRPVASLYMTDFRYILISF